MYLRLPDTLPFRFAGALTKSKTPLFRFLFPLARKILPQAS
jgi:hypothetical protein